MQDEIEFDPHLLRQIPHPLTNCEALINLVKAVLGTGVLSMPHAYYNAGWVNAIASTVIIGIISVYAKHILIHGMYELCKREEEVYLTYSQSMAAALREGPTCLHRLSALGEILVDCLLVIYCMGNCCVYVVFVADNIKQVVDYYSITLDNRIFMCALTFPLILIYLIRNLKKLSLFGALANILLMAGSAVVLYYVFLDLPPLESLRKFQDLEQYPLFFGVLLFSMESVGLMIAIEANMQKPKDYLGFFGVLNVGMLLIMTFYIFFGFFGYWRYGDDIKDSITLNIPEDRILPQITKILFAIAIFISYAFQGYVTMDVLWFQHISKHILAQRRRATEYACRVFLVLATVLLSILIPHLGLFCSLVGSFCYSILGVIFPGVIDMLVQYKVGYGFLKIYLIKDILIILFGMTGCTLGTYTAIKAIVAEYEKP